MRWHLVDKFEVLKKGSYARALKAYSGQEDFFAEHFPGNPRVPEPLFVEMIAQTGGVLFGLGLEFKKEVILVKISESKFYKAVTPPCKLEIEVELREESESGAVVRGEVWCEDEKVASAEILLMSIDSLDASQDKKIVFNEGFMEHYQVMEVAQASEAR